MQEFRRTLESHVVRITYTWLLAILFSAFGVSASAQVGVGVNYSISANALTGERLRKDNVIVTSYPNYDAAMASVLKATSIKNVVSLVLNEETSTFLPTNFKVTVHVFIQYSQSLNTWSDPLEKDLVVEYSKDPGANYKVRDYVVLEGWKNVKVTVAKITAENNGSLDVSQLLTLQNEMFYSNNYELSSNTTSLIPIPLSPNSHFYSEPVAGADAPDELPISWAFPKAAGNNFTQIEWNWIQDESFDVNASAEQIFSHNATRVDLPVGITHYTIPLFYDGPGKLLFRIRATNVKENGSRSDGPWSNTEQYDFDGHNNNLNWQVTTSFAEEGKRKTVMQYFDGSLRSRQTVTKDNSTNTTVTAETMYDGQGRPAVQILPAPGIDNVIAYRQGLNLFNTAENMAQSFADNPADIFDLKPISGINTAPQLNTASGTSKYYSPNNPEMNVQGNAKLPDANGYPYTLTQYTPDGTGRVMAQSGVGQELSMYSGHETKYFYGNAAQEELDGLFGTEVGDYTHYFKNMVIDANGQGSVSYVDMHGRTIATALAGPKSGSLEALENAQYANQGGTTITRNLVNATSNRIKNRSIESINTILVADAGQSYYFDYALTPKALELAQCNGANICYDCSYDLEISITNESGNEAPIVRKFTNVQVTPDVDCNTPTPLLSAATDNLKSATINDNGIHFSEILPVGSYIVRKTLTINQSAFEAFKQDYLSKGLCKSKQEIIDSVYTVIQTSTGCNVSPRPPLDCVSCKAALGLDDQSGFAANYAASIGVTTPPPYSAELTSEIDAAYQKALKTCNQLNPNISHRLEAIRRGMMADLVPYSGQYAKDANTAITSWTNDVGKTFTRGAMYKKYDVFSSNNFRHPQGEDLKDAPYKNTYGQIDPTINSQLTSITPSDFKSIFSFAWTDNLLPHHPEFAKLKFAESIPQVYDYADQFALVNTYSKASENGYLIDPTNHDPYFTTTNTADAATMHQFVLGKKDGSGKVIAAWYEGLTFWQMAYGNYACASIKDKLAQEDCFKRSPTQPDGSFTTIPPNFQDSIWAKFKGFYMAVRDSMLADYVNKQKPLSDASTLVDQGYSLHFPLSNKQMAKQFDWEWYPDNTENGAYTGASLPGIDPQQTINTTNSGHCLAYTNNWTAALLNCEALKNHPQKDQLVNEIISRMVALCQRSTDATNPYGASSLPANTTMPNGDRDFEQIVYDVFSHASTPIGTDLFCNPYVIEYPKPYGKNGQLTPQFIAVLDTCACKQYANVTAAAAAAGADIHSLTSLNNFLQTNLQDTITAALFEGLQHCAQLGVITCSNPQINNGGCVIGSAADSLVLSTPRTEALPYVYQATVHIKLAEGFRSLDNDSFHVQVDSTLLPCITGQNGERISTMGSGSRAICDTTSYTYTLPQIQPLPEFLTCGYVNLNEHCLTCKKLGALTTEFRTLFPAYSASPKFDHALLSDDELKRNVLYEQFINFRTGFSYNWINYSQAIQAAACDITADQTNNTNTTPVICASGKPITDTTGLLVKDAPCQTEYNNATNIGTTLYEKRLEELLANFEEAYTNKCLAAKDEEVFTVTCPRNEYHYTLYYYDVAGNLVKTVPPKGVRPDFTNASAVEAARRIGADVLMPHELVTNYHYNSLNQVVAQQTPDAGSAQFWYDRLGRLVVSQNAKQYNNHHYSYTLYDELGRIKQVGELTNATAITDPTCRSNSFPDAWITRDVAGTKTQITTTTYDEANPILDHLIIAQSNLRNRVSWTAVYNTAADLDPAVAYASASFYSYDVHGNVDTLLHDYRNGVMSSASGSISNQYKRIVYKYDLISGKVNEVAYQPDIPARNGNPRVVFPDKFLHQYTYDAENRLIEVRTSRDSIYWETDATYAYYKHGPLRRTQLGKLHVQGIDYVYTLQGWLKSINQSATNLSGTQCGDGFAKEDVVITDRAGGLQTNYNARNSVSLEEGFENGSNGDYFTATADRNLPACTITNGGNNGMGGMEDAAVARDAYNVVLNYYDSDYTGIGYTAPVFNAGSNSLGTDNYKPLYNGNISSMAVNISQLNSPMVYAYQYDQLNRLVRMHTLNSSDENWRVLTVTDDYKERIAYDPNGNILSYLRNGARASQNLNNYTYNYTANTNRVASINNSVNNNNANYDYDEIGNVTKDDKQNVTQSNWNVYGKLESVQKTDGTNITYTYDAAGNRNSKTVVPATGGIGEVEWYVRDASGNMMSTYVTGDNELNNGHLTQSEVYLYGSSRLGMQRPNIDVTVAQNNSINIVNGMAYTYEFTRGQKTFDLTDHRENVLTTVSDKKLQHTSDNATADYYLPDVTSASDYSVFGAINRSSNADNVINAFNGQRRSTEISPTAQTAQFWEYNGDVGRRWNVDPKANPSISIYVCFVNNPILNIDFLGDTVIIKNGIASGDNVSINLEPVVDRGKLPKGTQAIILHRTEGGSTEGAISAWKEEKGLAGAHVVVDKDGKITQVVNFNNKANQVGKTKDKSYPNNSNSVGVEVVGRYNEKTKTWEPLTNQQVNAVADLVNGIMKAYGLTQNNIYEHDVISWKTDGEGTVVRNAIKAKLNNPAPQAPPTENEKKKSN